MKISEVYQERFEQVVATIIAEHSTKPRPESNNNNHSESDTTRRTQRTED